MTAADTPAADSPRTSRSVRPVVHVVLSLVGLTALAVVQPLLDLLGRNAEFLVVHDVGRLEIVVLTLALAFGVPLAAAGFVIVVRLINVRAGDVLHGVLIAVLVALLVLVALGVSGVAWPGGVQIGGAVAVGVVGALVYFRSARARWLASLLAVAAPSAVVLFLFATPARGLLFPAASRAAAVDISGRPPPIVMVIFDELPLASLLDSQRIIDAGTYPGFAKLADDATFFRNATASHPSTLDALPALLSGRYSDADSLPNTSDHPITLFSLLRGSYRLHGSEPLTELCTAPGCRHGVGANSNPYLTLLRDLMVVQAHLFVPADLSDGLPPVGEGWRDFGGEQETAGAREAFLDQARKTVREDHPGAFRRFTREMHRTSRPTLHVLHSLLPHRPWRYLPDGRRHLGMGEPAIGEDGWTTRPWPAAQGYQLHLAQTQLADLLLGRLITRLERLGMYDETLIVVVADHGASFMPGTPLRTITSRTFGELAAVPLLVKTPGQDRGIVSDRPVETVDVAPTVLDAIGAPPVPDADGVSLMDAGAPARSVKKLIDSEGHLHEFDTSQDQLFAAVDRKYDIFGTRGAFDVYDLLPPGTDGLVGRRTPAESSATVPGVHVTLARRSAYGRVRPSSAVLPALVAGQVVGANANEPPTLAVAVNGRVEAVTVADLGNGVPGGFRALVRPEVFVRGANEVDILLVGPQGTLTRIKPAGTPSD